MKRFMNLNDSSHDSMVSIPGMPMRYKLKTKMAMIIWAIIFISPLILGMIFL